MFTKDGIRDFHTWLHQTLDILLQQVSTVPIGRLRFSLPGFGVPTVWKQLVHILEVEETWVLDLLDSRGGDGVKKIAPTVELFLRTRLECRARRKTTGTD